MEDSTISRRAFLKKFVVLGMCSVGGVRCLPRVEPVYGVTVTEPWPVPEYGAPPLVPTEPLEVPVYGVEPTFMPEYGVEPVPQPLYGVEPPPIPQVDGMSYLDKDGIERPLMGSTDVPTTAQFTIYFAHSMAESTQDAISLRDADGNAVDFEASWLGEQIALRLTPTTALHPATRYILEVSDEAKNTQGDSIRLTGSERVEFTTQE
jgi:hypothetical protein